MSILEATKEKLLHNSLIGKVFEENTRVVSVENNQAVFEHLTSHKYSIGPQYLPIELINKLHEYEIDVLKSPMDTRIPVTNFLNHDYDTTILTRNVVLDFWGCTEYNKSELGIDKFVFSNFTFLPEDSIVMDGDTAWRDDRDDNYVTKNLCTIERCTLKSPKQIVINEGIPGFKDCSLETSMIVLDKVCDSNELTNELSGVLENTTIKANVILNIFRSGPKFVLINSSSDLVNNAYFGVSEGVIKYGDQQYEVFHTYDDYHFYNLKRFAQSLLRI